MNPSPVPQAISFDVGGTLIDPWPSVGHVYAAVANETGLTSLDPDLLNDRFGKAWSMRSHFDYSRAAWGKLVEAVFAELIGRQPIPPDLFARLYDRFVAAEVWRIHDDAPRVLAALRERGFKLAAVSNWDDRLRPLLRNLGLDGWFDVIEVSAESGYHKPAAAIFQRMVAALGLSPGEVLHVGDSRLEDYAGARGAGLHGVLLNRGGVERLPDEIGSLRSLLRLLDEWGQARPR